MLAVENLDIWNVLAYIIIRCLQCYVIVYKTKCSFSAHSYSLAIWQGLAVPKTGEGANLPHTTFQDNVTSHSKEARIAVRRDPPPSASLQY